jgi:hypothetical protein
MNFTKHAEQRMVERQIARRDVIATLTAAKAHNVRESWKSPGTFMVFGLNKLVVVVDRSANILTAYREEN